MGDNTLWRPVPDECRQWCEVRDYGLTVGDDLAEVDLAWWNERLSGYGIPVQLWGRTIDGTPTASGLGYLRRDDLLAGPQQQSGAVDDLSVLYRCAAWLSAHHGRNAIRRFIDVTTIPRGPQGTALCEITAALRHCREESPTVLDPGPYRDWSGWTRTPGVGKRLLSLYFWAVHQDAVHRPQLLDPQSLASLCYLGWGQLPSIGRITRKRYLCYNRLLHGWAEEAGVAAELIEMWLVTSWRERTSDATHSSLTDRW